VLGATPYFYTMTKFQSSKEDVAYSITGMARFEGSPCFLVALTNWDISLIVSSLRYAHWRRRWLDIGTLTWDEVEAKVDNLERCLMSGCNIDTLIEVLQNALYYDDKGLAQILSEGQSSGQEGSVTLAEVLSNFEGDDILQYPAVYGLLQVLSDILPAEFVENYRIVDPPQFILGVVSELVGAIIAIVDTAFNGVSATANTGEVVSDAADTAISGLDTIFSGMTAGALSLSAILDLIGLFKSGQTPPADDNPALHTQVRVLNDVFVTQGAVNVSCAPDVNVTCGGGCVGNPVFDGNQDINNFVDAPPVEEPDPEGDPPVGFDTWEEYYTYKCQAANLLYDQYVGTLTNWAGLAGLSGALTVVVVMGVILVTVPPLGISLILAALVAIAGVDIGLFATFLDIVSSLNDSKETIVCDIFSSTDTTTANSVLTIETDAIIDGLEISETLKENFKSACSYLLSNYSAAMLFFKTGDAIGYEGTIDCSECGGSSELCGITVIIGTVVTNETVNGKQEITIDSADNAYHNNIWIYAANYTYDTGGAYCRFYIEKIEILSHDNPPFKSFIRHELDNEFTQHGPPVTLTPQEFFEGKCCQMIWLYDDKPAAFRIKLTLTGDCV